MSARNERGREAEQHARDFLLAQGLQVLACNYRWRGGELDLVCEDGRLIVVVEVRYRSNSGRYGGARGSIDAKKRGRLMRTTLHFLRAHAALGKRPVRFDVVAVGPDGAAGKRIEWIRNAFGEDGW